MAWANQEELHESSIYEALHTGLTVRMIMTPRSVLRTCRAEETIRAVAARNSQHYSFIPVVDDNSEAIAGLFHAEDYFENAPPTGSVSERFLPLSEAFLIGADASILEFIRNADQRPCRLVVAENRIEGLVSLSDIQKLPVRAALFALLTGFEITMAQAIRKRWRGSEWLDHLSKGRQDKLYEKIQKSKTEDTFIDELLLTEFSDKFDLVQKGFPRHVSKSQLSNAKSDVRWLRDMVAHANEYAASPDAAKRVTRAVGLLLSLRREIIESIR